MVACIQYWVVMQLHQKLYSNKRTSPGRVMAIMAASMANGTWTRLSPTLQACRLHKITASYTCFCPVMYVTSADVSDARLHPNSSLRWVSAVHHAQDLSAFQYPMLAQFACLTGVQKLPGWASNSLTMICKMPSNYGSKGRKHLPLARRTSDMTASSMMSMCASFFGYLKESASGASHPKP